MKLRVRHRTEYHYSAPVSQSVNRVCLTPRSTTGQICISSELLLTPAPEHIESSIDYYGNRVHEYSIDQPHTHSVITVSSLVETTSSTQALPDSVSVVELGRLLPSLTDTDSLLSHECLLTSPYVPVTQEVDHIVRALQPEQHSVLEFADALMRYIYHEFEYDPSFSTLVTPIRDVIAARKGVCQDFAHLCLAILRRTGIPARYVSGYVETRPPPGQVKLEGADASHAWFAVYAPLQGWFDFDPTNGQHPNEQYVTTAWGRDYTDVTPVKGVVFGGGKHSLRVAVDVNRV